MSSSEEESDLSNEEGSEDESGVEEEVSDDDDSGSEEEVIVAKPVKNKRSKKAPARGKKKKPFKDPNKPKRNMSAYFLYSNENRARVKQENPEAAFGDIAKLISAEFKSITDKERKKWDKKAAKDKERYLDQMTRYVAPEPETDSDDSSDGGARKKKKRKQVKDPNKPKRNMSAFFLYSCAHRADIKKENTEATFGELAGLVSVSFKALPDKERKKWDKKAAKDKIRYQEEMKNYTA